MPEPVSADLTLAQWQLKTGQDKQSQWEDPKIYYVTIEQKGKNIAVDIRNPKSIVTKVELYGARKKDLRREELYFIDWNAIQKRAAKDSSPYLFAVPAEQSEGKRMFFAKVYTADGQVLHSGRILFAQ